MSDLSQFLNSGGKRYRVASKDTVAVAASGGTTTVTPASDEFAIITLHSSRALDLYIPSRGLTLTNVNAHLSNPIELAFGVGESVTFTNNTTSSNEISYVIYEEDV